MNAQTSRPEAAFVLLLLQATFWIGAGLSAFPFVLGGEFHMAALGFASLLLALFAVLLGIGLVYRRRRARRLVIALEVTCLLGFALSLALPIGAYHGPVALMVNFALPAAVVWLLWGNGIRAAFARG